jgi:hypothetical protein
VVGAEPSDDAIVLEGTAFLLNDEAWRCELVPVYAAKYGMGIDPSEPVFAVRVLLFDRARRVPRRQHALDV